MDAFFMEKNDTLHKGPVILFDGVCNFCNGTVNFLLRQKGHENFRFAALQSEAGQRLLAQYNLSRTDLNSFVLFENGRIYQRSSAALRLTTYLSWYWKWAKLFWLVPKPMRDAVYAFIAKNRYKWFGKREQCSIPAPDARNRFLA